MSDALSTTSVLGLSNCVAIPEKVPPSAHNAPAAEFSCALGSGPSLIWNAFRLVPADGRTCTAMSRNAAPGVYGNCSPPREPKSTSIAAAFTLAYLFMFAITLGAQTILALKLTAVW